MAYNGRALQQVGKSALRLPMNRTKAEQRTNRLLTSVSPTCCNAMLVAVRSKTKTMSTKLVIYQTEDGKEIFRDFDAHFIPEKGMIVNFKETDKNICNLMDKERALNYSVSEIIFLIPNVMLVSVKMENNIQKFKQIENVIVDIMIKDGPDRHCDGSEKITEFIISLLAGNGEEWKREYRRLNDIEDDNWEG